MTTQPTLTHWFSDGAEPRRANPKIPTPRLVLCLGGDGLALRAWTRRGYPRRERDGGEGDPRRALPAVAARRDRIAFACALPRCTDLASSGARWWKRKRAANPNFQSEAIQKLRDTERVLRASGAPYVMLTPASALIKKLWKSPRAVVSPHQYGGYLVENAAHPVHPDVIPTQDRYHKSTYVFSGNGFVLPRRKPRPPVWVLKKNKKTGKVVRISPVLAKRKHRNARRYSPLGFMEAIAQLHAKDLR